AASPERRLSTSPEGMPRVLPPQPGATSATAATIAMQPERMSRAYGLSPRVTFPSTGPGERPRFSRAPAPKSQTPILVTALLGDLGFPAITEKAASSPPARFVTGVVYVIKSKPVGRTPS